MDYVLVQTTFNDMPKARQMAAALKREFGAESKKIKTTRSLYWWKGKVEDGDEQILTLKIRADSFKAVEDYITRDHKYELPCVIALPVPGSSSSSFEPTDCVVATALFTNQQDADRAASDLVHQCFSAAAKVFPTAVLWQRGDKPSLFLVTAETTKEKFDAIRQLHMQGSLGSIEAMPIINGSPEFLKWIRDSVTQEPKAALAQVLAGLETIPSRPLDNTL